MSLTGRGNEPVDLPQLSWCLVNVKLPIIPLISDVGLDQRIKTIDDTQLPRRAVLEVNREMVNHEPDERLLGRWDLSAHKHAGLGKSDEIDVDEKRRQSTSGVEGCDIGSERLLGIGSDECPLGVEDEPEGHGERTGQQRV